MARTAVRANPDVVEELSAEDQALMDADRDTAVETPEPAESASDAASEPQGDAAITDEGGEPTDGQPARTQMVPHQALHEERTRRQEAEKRVQLAEERLGQLLQRVNFQPAPQPQQQSAAPQLPALEADPVGHILGRQAQTEALLGQIVQAVVGQDQQTQAQRNESALTTRAAALERTFAAENPDYPNAAQHLLEARRADLAASGWYAPEEIQMMLAHEAKNLAETAITRGENPAAVVYRLAQSRGYAKAADPDPAQNGNGTTTPNGAERVQTIARGQQQARSIGQVRGQGPAPMTVDRLLAMTGEEYLKAIETAEGKALMG